MRHSTAYNFSHIQLFSHAFIAHSLPNAFTLSFIHCSNGIRPHTPTGHIHSTLHSNPYSFILRRPHTQCSRQMWIHRNAFEFGGLWNTSIQHDSDRFRQIQTNSDGFESDSGRS